MLLQRSESVAPEAYPPACYPFDTTAVGIGIFAHDLGNNVIRNRIGRVIAVVSAGALFVGVIAFVIDDDALLKHDVGALHGEIINRPLLENRQIFCLGKRHAVLVAHFLVGQNKVGPFILSLRFIALCCGRRGLRLGRSDLPDRLVNVSLRGSSNGVVSAVT